MEEVKPMEPERKFRAGGVSATVWINSNEKGLFPSVQLSRSYLDKQNNWKDTNSFKVSDIPKAVLVLGEAYRYLSLKGKEKLLDA